jgi:glycosyltransferase involved in cell wall biosynthesis
MRILFLGKRHYTNQDAFVQRFGRIRWLPFLWHQAEHAVRLILLDYHGYRKEVCVDDGMTVQALPAFAPGSISYLSTAARELQPDVVVASGDCFLGLVGQRLARRTGAKFVFDVYDDYRTFGAYRAFMGWDALGYLCRHADLVMYASKAIAGKHRFDSPCVVVPNGVDGTEFAPVPMPEARARLGLPQAGRLVGYFGSMTAEHGVTVLIQALAKLRTRQPDVQLLLCGRQHPSTPVTGEGVVYRGMVPHAIIHTYLNACDVLALPYLRGAFIDNASSCKIAEYLFCRRPIVATRTPHFVENFPEQARQLQALLVPPGDADALAHSIQHQLDDPVILQAPDDMAWDQIAPRLLMRFGQLQD